MSLSGLRTNRTSIMIKIFLMVDNFFTIYHSRIFSILIHSFKGGDYGGDGGDGVPPNNSVGRDVIHFIPPNI